MKAVDQIKELLDEMLRDSDSSIIEVNNRYCESCNIDGRIYENDEEFFQMFDFSGYEVAQMISYGEYKFSHRFVKFDGYGNLVSFNFLDEENFVELTSVVAEYIVENPSEFKDITDELDSLIEDSLFE